MNRDFREGLTPPLFGFTVSSTFFVPSFNDSIISSFFLAAAALTADRSSRIFCFAASDLLISDSACSNQTIHCINTSQNNLLDDSYCSGSPSSSPLIW